MARCFNAFRLSGCLIMLGVYGCHYLHVCKCAFVSIFMYIYVLVYVHFLFCIVLFGWLLFSSTLTALFNPPHCTLPLLLSASSSCLLLSTLLSSPLLSSYVDEIRWFLLGEASVHPSAAPSRTCPTPSIQVINKPANSHSPSITCCLFSTSAVLYVRPCPYAAPCELTASQHTDRPTYFPIYPSEKDACHRMVWTEVTDGSEGHASVLKEWQ